jgi:hypothetical protein
VPASRPPPRGAYAAAPSDHALEKSWVRGTQLPCHSPAWFGLLRNAAIRRDCSPWQPCWGGHNDLAQVKRTAIAGAVTEYSRLRERTIANAGTEQLGFLAHEMS